MPPPVNNAQRWIVGLSGALALSLPVAAVCALGLGLDRGAVASAASAAFAMILNALFICPFVVGTPGAGSKATTAERARCAAAVFFATWTVIALTWELGWLLVRAHLPELQDSYAGYAWWVYIDAGDQRYLTAPTDLVVMEVLSVANAVVCASALRTLLWEPTTPRSRASHRTAALQLAMVAAVHLYSTTLYYAVEIAHGCPSCDWERPANVFFAFGLANLPWLYMPPVVLWWARDVLASSSGDDAAGQRRRNKS